MAGDCDDSAVDGDDVMFGGMWIHVHVGVKEKLPVTGSALSGTWAVVAQSLLL